MASFRRDLVLNAWQEKGPLFHLVLVPLSWVFGALTWLRRNCYRFGLFRSYALPVPVIVVGNINMGGSGKTPVVMWLVDQLKQQGYNPGVISRGYGAHVKAPSAVNPHSLARNIGDEPLLIAKRCQCPVWVGKNRVKVARAMLSEHPECNVIISDDGLQHYRLKRTFEIVVLADAHLKRAKLLPAGPLRESYTRLKSVDAIICNGQKTIDTAYEMRLVGAQFYNLANHDLKAEVADFKRKAIKAMAGIGNPERFFEHLRNLGLSFASLSFGDHHPFIAKDLANADCDALIMTEKDAVKCQPFAQPHYWVLPVDVQIDSALLPKILEKIARK